jgi:methionyl-tRNA formyltransferase
MRTDTVVFAYSEVGARCLSALLRGGVSVRLVVTHEDDPQEQRWFSSVADVARTAGCSVITPADPATPEVQSQIAAIAPEFIFSFYYRRMLPATILALARRGALNMHGSLLPKYRGRAPVNWAVLHGETQTGASLHYMVAKPDAGPLVDQEAVPIGPDDTAFEVAGRVAEAAVVTLERALPGLLAGTAPAIPLDLGAGSYFGGRRPSDGELQLRWPARRFHDLVRAVAPPFPGAFLVLGSVILRIHRTRHLSATERAPDCGPSLGFDAGRLIAHCGDGGQLEIVQATAQDVIVDHDRFIAIFGCDRVPAPPMGAESRNL